MQNHSFILTPGKWLGEGDVQVSIPTDPLKFYSQWLITEKDDGVITFSQDVEMTGFAEPMKNTFSISELTKSSFNIILENPVFGVVEGKGLINESNISWEFKEQGAQMEGFEIYTRVSEQEYTMRAEYVSDEHMRTIVKGKVWKKVSK